MMVGLLCPVDLHRVVGPLKTYTLEVGIAVLVVRKLPVGGSFQVDFLISYNLGIQYFYY